MIDIKTLDLATISWGILIIAFSLAIIAGKVTFKR